jgi:hypothetical protein
MDLAGNWYVALPPLIELADPHTPQLVLISSVFFAVGSILAAVANSFTLVYVQHLPPDLEVSC